MRKAINWTGIVAGAAIPIVLAFMLSVDSG